MRYLTTTLFIFILFASKASYLFIPMDNSQKNHLKAYGIAYWILQHETEVYWLLNYKGGSFMYKNTHQFENENIKKLFQLRKTMIVLAIGMKKALLGVQRTQVIIKLFKPRLEIQ